MRVKCEYFKQLQLCFLLLLLLLSNVKKINVWRKVNRSSKRSVESRIKIEHFVFVMIFFVVVVILVSISYIFMLQSQWKFSNRLSNSNSSSRWHNLLESKQWHVFIFCCIFSIQQFALNHVSSAKQFGNSNYQWHFICALAEFIRMQRQWPELWHSVEHLKNKTKKQKNKYECNIDIESDSEQEIYKSYFFEKDEPEIGAKFDIKNCLCFGQQQKQSIICFGNWVDDLSLSLSHSTKPEICEL